MSIKKSAAFVVNSAQACDSPHTLTEKSTLIVRIHQVYEFARYPSFEVAVRAEFEQIYGCTPPNTLQSYDKNYYSQMICEYFFL